MVTLGYCYYFHLFSSVRSAPAVILCVAISYRSKPTTSSQIDAGPPWCCCYTVVSVLSMYVLVVRGFDSRPLLGASAAVTGLHAELIITAVHCESFLLVALQAVAACSVFLSTTSSTAVVPCVARRQISLWCRRHSRQCHLRGPCSGGPGRKGGGYQGWDNSFLRSSRRQSSYQDYGVREL